MHHGKECQLERLADKDLSAKEKWAATWEETSVSVRHMRLSKKKMGGNAGRKCQITWCL
jgi:hypothetical protein